MKLSTKLCLFCCVVLVSSIAACELFGPDNGETDFGYEAGYFRWYRGEERPLFRDRNHLSIYISEQYGQSFHDSLLQAYGIETVRPQSFGFPVHFPGLYRVTQKPAEEYYTTYGDLSKSRLGNLPEVEYVLPVFYVSERNPDARLTPKILHTFHEHISEDRRAEIRDSLRAADGVELRQDFPYEEWSVIYFYVTKHASRNPYDLYHHYHDLPFFRTVGLNFTITVRR